MGHGPPQMENIGEEMCWCEGICRIHKWGLLLGKYCPNSNFRQPISSAFAVLLVVALVVRRVCALVRCVCGRGGCLLVLFVLESVGSDIDLQLLVLLAECNEFVPIVVAAAEQ